MDALGTLQQLAGGHLIDDLCAAVVTTAEEVVATGRPGAVTLTLKIEKVKGNDLTVQVVEEIKRKPPARDAHGAFFFAMDGALHRDDPRQVRMELRVVEGQTELRTADDHGQTMRETS